MSRLSGQRALVTGASRGIGRAVALRLASEGASVALNYNSGRDEAEAVAAEIVAAGGSAVTLQGNVADAAQAEALVEAAVGALGGLDVLVNNAGITRDNLLMRLSEEDWDAVIDTNLKGVFLCTKAAIRPMLRQRSGRIVNMSSVVALTGNPGQANYTAAKAGLIGFTRTVAREVASRGITVNAIAPGFIATQMVDSIPEDLQAQIRERIPLGAFGTPEDVAGCVAFLVSADAAYITGQVLSIDGGLGL
ncbi:MAG: 3-oxoacyl-[acyl-carrier-protein] reductase [Chloroflexota bacterium]|nr:3-oxoacyl-[acyl-carrier-protein] reductase [Chloroflexota bacterium]MDE2884335.1 3-oxoacyl-[acyl-carrier-protein] reductase [Chloroflexota bacterium]